MIVMAVAAGQQCPFIVEHGSYSPRQSVRVKRKIIQQSTTHTQHHKVLHISDKVLRSTSTTLMSVNVLRAACLPSLSLACGQRCVVAHQAAVALVRSLVRHGGAAEVLKSALFTVKWDSLRDPRPPPQGVVLLLGASSSSSLLVFCF